MGILFGKIWNRLFHGNEEIKICIVGLNNAGKTTILYRLHLGEVVVTHPTIGSNVEEIKHKSVRFQAWDLGGQESLRPSWSMYFSGAQAVVLVVDSTDRERMSVSKEELFKMLANEDLKTSCVMVFANKQDMKDAMTAAEISDALALHSIRSHDWHIQACCALTGEGLDTGLDWIANNVRSNRAARSV